MNTQSLIQSLQGSIAPCILISGLGLLLLSLTNRLGRVLDRIRALNSSLSSFQGKDRSNIQAQLKVLFKRSRILQAAVGLILLSIFFVSLVMLMLFSSLTLNFKFIEAVKLCFILSLLGLIASLILSFLDISFTLASVRLEMQKEN